MAQDNSLVYVAVDIGASSGRLLLGQLNHDGKLVLDEIYRFENGFTKVDGHDRWQIDYLLEQILIGLAKVKTLGFQKIVLGIDTWAVDYVLVDQLGNKLADPISYRDRRTMGAMTQLTSHFSPDYLYQKTGIQFQNFNTLFQLYVEDRELLAKTNKILLIPDYLAFRLTGRAVAEVTNASTTQMLSLTSRLFDEDVLEYLKIATDKLPPLVEAGTWLGMVKASQFSDFDLPETQVIAVATHDTASAVVGTPALTKNWAFLSSGTWSLLGQELNQPLNTMAALKANYTNEWGAYGTYRFLKNIMGLWLAQSIRHELGDRYSFQELADMAVKEKPFAQVIDVNDIRFQNPSSMIKTLQDYCREKKQPVPVTPGELMMAVYSNLALAYANNIKQLTAITGQPVDVLHLVGGGSHVDLLNQLTANLAQVTVAAGPGEATAIGNLLVQMIATGTIRDLKTARELIATSFPPTNYHPEPVSNLADLQAKFHQINQ